MSFTVKAIMITISASLLISCASKNNFVCSGDKTPAPAWLNKTAFELSLPSGFHYGKGTANTQKEALANAYGDIAQRVAVNIFSRSVVEQTSNAIRAEAITKAISDVNATGIEPLFEWQNSTSCQHHIMVRVLKKTAASWKTKAQSYLVSRPGLGQVRRPDFEIHAIRYGEIGKPKLLLKWRQASFLGKRAIIESELRKALRRSKIELTNNRAVAKNTLLFNLISSGQNVVLEASLFNKDGEVLAKSAHEAEIGNFNIVAKNLIRDILNEWLNENDDMLAPFGR